VGLPENTGKGLVEHQEDTQMEKSEALKALQTETRRHSFDTFVDEPPKVYLAGI
jgi:hypothetical protein